MSARQQLVPHRRSAGNWADDGSRGRWTPLSLWKDGPTTAMQWTTDHGTKVPAWLEGHWRWSTTQTALPVKGWAYIGPRWYRRNKQEVFKKSFWISWRKITLIQMTTNTPTALYLCKAGPWSEPLLDRGTLVPARHATLRWLSSSLLGCQWHFRANQSKIKLIPLTSWHCWLLSMWKSSPIFWIT